MSTAQPVVAGGPKAIELSRRRQTLITGWLRLILAVFVAAVFGIDSTGSATFRFAMPGDVFAMPSLVVPAAPYAYVVAAALAFLGILYFLPSAAR